jgi:hypothetical protein
MGRDTIMRIIAFCALSLLLAAPAAAQLFPPGIGEDDPARLPGGTNPPCPRCDLDPAETVRPSDPAPQPAPEPPPPPEPPAAGGGQPGTIQ